jgi:hypothetical protein
MTNEATINSLPNIRNFLTGGHAVFTLVSKKSGARKTFRVRVIHPKPGYTKPGFFVDLLIAPDTYKYLGFLHENRTGELVLKLNANRWGTDAYEAFCWILYAINFDTPAKFFDSTEFWHSGNCARCGRALTVPESIASGIGPVCAGRMS